MSGAVRRLRLVEGAAQQQPEVRFCGHCGQPPRDPAQEARVCARCGMGILLTTAAVAAPRPDDPFLVLDERLTVCALSAAAEELLGVEETTAVHCHVAEFLHPADAESPEALVTGVIEAAGQGEPLSMVVRPAFEFGVRYRVRVAACWPPRAALLVLTAV